MGLSPQSLMGRKNGGKRDRDDQPRVSGIAPAPAPAVDLRTPSSGPYTPSAIEKAQGAIALFETQLDRPSVHVQIATLIQEGVPHVSRMHPKEPVSTYLQKPMQIFFGDMLGLDQLIMGQKLSDRAIHKDGTRKNHADQVHDALSMLDVCSSEPILSEYIQYYKFALELALRAEKEPEPSIPPDLVPSWGSNT